MGKNVHTPEVEKLLKGILCLNTVEECYSFFEDLCTINELLSLGQRLSFQCNESRRETDSTEIQKQME